MILLLNNMLETNSVKATGKIVSPIEFSHELFGEGFYNFYLEVPRLSETVDVLPVTISERLIVNMNLKEGTYVKIIGQLRSYNRFIDGSSKLILTVFARDIELLEDEEEIKENLPEAVFHATNKTWSRFSAQSYHDALMTLAEKVHQALQNAKQLKDSSITKIGEATFTVEFLNRLAADVTSELPFVKRLSSRTIEFTMSDYDQAFHAFQAIVFMASSAMRL